MANYEPVIQSALKSVPAVRYAVGIAGIAASFALATSFFRGDKKAAFFGVCAMLVLMILLRIFSSLPRQNRSLALIATFMMWCVSMTFMSVCILIVTSVFFLVPRPFPAILSDIGIISSSFQRNGNVVVESLGAPTWGFLGSGGGIGPPRWREGRYGVDISVRVTNPTRHTLQLYAAHAEILDSIGRLAHGSVRLAGSPDFNVESGATKVVGLQITTQVVRDSLVFLRRFQQSEGEQQPRIERNIRGTVIINYSHAEGLDSTIIPITTARAVISPFQ